MALFDEKVRKQLGDILSQMGDPVNLVYFTQELECTTCRDTHSFVEEISSLSEKLNLTVYDFVNDADRAEEFGVDKIPAIVILDSSNNDTGIKYYGIPAGYEINSFLGSILEVSGKKEAMPDDLAARISAIDKDVHIQVYVALT